MAEVAKVETPVDPYAKYDGLSLKGDGDRQPETPKVEPVDKPAETATETTPATTEQATQAEPGQTAGDGQAKPHQLDKGLQRVQDRLSKAEKWQETASATLERLSTALERFNANPTQANAQAVNTAQGQAQAAGVDLSALNDEDLIDGKTYKAALKERDERLAAVEAQLTQTRQQIDPMVNDATVGRAQRAYLGQFPGTKADDFKAAYNEAAEELKGYEPVMASMTQQQRSQFADTIAERVILRHGQNRLAAIKAPEAEPTPAAVPPPTTAKGSTKITTGATIAPNLPAPKPAKGIEDVYEKYGRLAPGALKGSVD